jgi:large subunit ribosomal protein L30
MEMISITQIKSGINRPENQKRTLKALGLSMNKTVEMKSSPQLTGMLSKVTHLVRIVKK